MIKMQLGSVGSRMSKRAVMTATLVVWLSQIQTVFSQQILSQSRVVSAYSETYEPFFDNITITDSDEDSTTSAGAFNASVNAATDFLTTDFGSSSASQTSTIGTTTFQANGVASAASALNYGADSLANGVSGFEVTFRLNRRGRLNLVGTMQGAGTTYYPGEEGLVDNVFASLVVTNVNTGAVVYSKRMGLGQAIDLEDGSLNLARGTYKVAIVASCENTTYPTDYFAAFDTFAEFDIHGTISLR